MLALVGTSVADVSKDGISFSLFACRNTGNTANDPIAVIINCCKSLEQMNESEPLSTRRMVFGLVCGAIIGLTCYVVLEASIDVFSQFIAVQFFGYEWRELHFVGTVSITALFGAPIALFMGLIVGLPIWRYAENQPLRSYRSAALYGAICGGCIGIILLIIGLLIGLGTFLDDRSSYNSWSYGYQVTRDGLPTVLGWVLQLKTLMFFAVAGSLAGATARLVAFPR